MGYINLKGQAVLDGAPFVLEQGFLFASINPGDGVTYDIVNSLGETVPGIDVPFTFPFPSGISIQGYAEHTITPTGGNLKIVYLTGN